MGISLTQKLYAAGFGQSTETVKYLGSVGAELFDRQTRHRKGYPKLPFVGLDLIQQQGVHRQVTFLCDFLKNRPIGQIVQIVVVLTHIEETVPFQP